MEKIIYTKTLKWRGESEYRLAIPLAPGEKPWNTLSYHPDEITELYLGADMAEADKKEITALAKGINPKIAVFQVKRGDKGQMTFDQT